MIYHQPVLLTAVLDLINPQPGDLIIDGTLGNGGHTQELLKSGAVVIGFDLDPAAITTTSSRIRHKNLTIVNDNFANIPQYLSDHDLHPRAILLDLGLNLNQYKSDDRGFTFSREEKLDMRLNPNRQTLTAEEIINTWSEQDLYLIFSKLSQDKLSRPLAKSIVRHRQKKPIISSLQLAQIIQGVYQYFHFSPAIHPATKIFMALRIEVNQEYENLKKFLLGSLKLTGTQVAIITFHSGEDRIVKRFIQQNSVVTPSKSIKPSIDETRFNPLSRSAILRSYKIN